jgi:hypothetical protein
MKTILIILQMEHNPDSIFYLAGSVIGLFLLYIIIKNATSSKQIIANQEETIRLLKKIAGEPEIINNIDKNENI